jgi:pimeloyl-ACP methyl ester carboxylesterase
MLKNLIAGLMLTAITVPALARPRAPAAPPAHAASVKNIVLVHGAWADGSGWRGVYDILKKDGYNVSIVANPLTSLADDVAATERVLSRQNGPTILVGHSYGGAVITEAGMNAKVVGLVYIAAFVPDVGESVFGFLPKDGPQLPIEPTADGFAFFNRNAYLAAFAPDVDPALGSFMADEQVPVSIAAGNTPLTSAAWKTKPSWYLVSKQDRIIPPGAELMMATRAKAVTAEVDGSHVAFISHPEAAAALIESAARGDR